jgi:hypothetical protein
LKVVASEFGEEQITRLACCGGEKRKKKIERGDCWRGIAAGCGLGTNRMLAVFDLLVGEKKEQKRMQVCNYGFSTVLTRASQRKSLGGELERANGLPRK